MPSIVPIVEGDGEVTALPELLRRLLYEEFLVYDWQILRPKNAHGCGNLTAPNGIERFVRYALIEPECDAIFILIDRDAVLGLPEAERPADDCVPAFAQILVERVARLNPSIPVVIVIACWEYETWFLASLETVIPSLGPYQGDVEALRSPKGWIERQLRSKHKQVYRETSDQVKMTYKLDLNLTEARSRSFRRLKNALAEILQAHQEGKAIVTPSAKAN